MVGRTEETDVKPWKISTLDDVIEYVGRFLGFLIDVRNIQNSGNCNNCNKKKNCGLAPEPGQMVRYNCPYYEGEQDG